MLNETPISFEAFMRDALHDPTRGYYSRHITGVGQRGDFTTVPMISEAPAKAISAWAARAMKECGCRDLIEIGPGEGKLAKAVMKHLPVWQRWQTRLHLVETSAPLIEKQRAILGQRAQWHRSPADALAACGGKAVIYSNELVDAFPVRVFQKTDESWCELAVSISPDGRIQESLLPPAPLPESSGFTDLHPIGQRIEVHESYLQWLETWLPAWQAGRMLTIDYGAESHTLYHRRPRGTVRAYFFQQRLEGHDIYQNPGRQDITADINFSDLIAHGTKWSSEQQIMIFRDFLGIHADAMTSNDPGAGTAFLVLEQKRSESFSKNSYRD